MDFHQDPKRRKLNSLDYREAFVKGRPYSITERRLPLLSARPAVTHATLKRAVTSFDAWGTEAKSV